MTTPHMTMEVLDQLGISSQWTPIAFFLRPAEPVDAITQHAKSVEASRRSSEEATQDVHDSVRVIGIRQW